jgi:DNA-binding response OmpR family regulator
MSKFKILIVEDDKAILTGLRDLLVQEGFQVTIAMTGPSAIRAHAQDHPDLIVLDVMIPEKNGFEVCKEIRKTDPSVAIVMLTSREQEIDKVVGLQVGADDYVIKPFSIHEFLARVHAALRRKQIKPPDQKNKDPLSFGNVRIDVKTMTGFKGKKSFAVSDREIQLLQLFCSNPNEVLERSTILSKVWGITYTGTTRTLDQHIVKLRQKIEENPSFPKHILTVHGVGYRFKKDSS